MGAVKVIVSRELVVKLATTGKTIGPATCETGLPEGCRLSGAGIDQNGDLLIRFSGDSLPECSPGDKPELFTPVYLAGTT